MKTILSTISKVKLYDFKTTLPKGLFVLIHLMIIGIFVLVIVFAGCSEEKALVPGNTPMKTAKKANAEIRPLCARWYKGVVYLSWTSPSNLPQGYYVVERLEHGTNRTTYIDIIPNRENNTKCLYSTEDIKPLKGGFYYKIWFISDNNTYGETDKLYPEKELTEPVSVQEMSGVAVR